MKGKKVIFVGPLPPPLHGFSNINKLMVDRIRHFSDVLIIDKARGGHRVLSWLWSLSSIFVFLWKLLINRPKVLYMGLSGGYGQIIDLPFVVLASIFRLEIYIHHHSFNYINEPRWFNGIVMSMLREARHISLCELMAAELSRIYSVRRELFSVVSNAAFLSESVGDESRSGRNEIKLGFISNITREKGIFDFFDLIERLNVEGVRFSAEIAGPLDESIRDEFFAVLDLFGNVKYVGPVYGDRKSEFYSSIDLLVFPTRYRNEAEPVTIWEAFRQGVPVIAMRRGCIPGMLKSGGLFFSEAEFAQKAFSFFCELAAEPDRLSEMARSAKSQFDTVRNADLVVLDGLVGEMVGMHIADKRSSRASGS